MAWLGVDSRGPTSVYFASDSRISWSNDKKNWDTARKLFATQSTAEIFGFTGYALLPQVVLTRVCDFIDRGFRVLPGSHSPENCAIWLKDIIESQAKAHPREYLQKDFSILYAVRHGHGMPGRATFHLFRIHWSVNAQSISLNEIHVPAVSGLLLLDGSGTESMKEHEFGWRISDQGNTSRTLFSAFCDSLKSGMDEFSGGEPQLVGLYRTGNANVFGIVTESGSSIEGCLNLPIPLNAKIEWRDNLFQRVTREGKLLKKAQPHSRPGNLTIPVE